MKKYLIILAIVIILLTCLVVGLSLNGLYMLGVFG